MTLSVVQFQIGLKLCYSGFFLRFRSQLVSPTADTAK